MDMFYNRLSAGKELARKLNKHKRKDVIVFAIPRGGVPVALPIARKLNARLDLMVVRKIPIPFNPEAGFGAVAPDGTLSLNKPLVQELGLRKREIKDLAADVLKEVKRRTKTYRGRRPFPSLKGKIVILVDDGLASGFTMIAAVRSMRKHKPKSIVVAVPVSSKSAAEEVRPLADELICLVVSDVMMFAVASFYKNFPDLSDKDVMNYLKERS